MTKRHTSHADRKHILWRDSFTCRYCGAEEGTRFDGKPLTDLQRREFQHLPRGQKAATKSGICSLTLDHVIPKSRGGSDLYDNFVSACVLCNNRKADRTPKEAGMTLLPEPPRKP